MYYKPQDFVLNDLENEIWKDILGYEGLYKISNLGRIKSIARRIPCRNNRTRSSATKILKQNRQNGYYVLQLQRNGVYEVARIHRLVAEHFIENPNNKPLVNHKNGTRSDNRSSNLEWVTYKENSRHAFEIGLCENRPRGERVGIAVLDDNTVMEIFKSSMRHVDLRDRYRVSIGTISNIKTGKTWTHVTQKQLFMIKTSFKWIRQCILTSENRFHLECCHKLIDLFTTQYSGEKECSLMVEDLQTELREKETFLIVEV